MIHFTVACNALIGFCIVTMHAQPCSCKNDAFVEYHLLFLKEKKFWKKKMSDFKITLKLKAMLDWALLKVLQHLLNYKERFSHFNARNVISLLVSVQKKKLRFI